VQPSQLYVGSRVVVFARQLHLTAYGDEATRRAVEARAERCVKRSRQHARDAPGVPARARTTPLVLHAVLCRRTLALIKPGATHHTGQLLHAIHSGGFSIMYVTHSLQGRSALARVHAVTL
jgi:hypothetical protein